MPSTFEEFWRRLVALKSHGDELASDVLHIISEYFYQQSPDADSEFSSFEEFWRNNCPNVLRLDIDLTVAGKLADIFHAIVASGKLPNPAEVFDVTGVPPERIANVRFFTAAQDFDLDINRKRHLFKDPEAAKFHSKAILEGGRSTIIELLDYLGVAEAQLDKRMPWMEAQAQYLANRYEGEAINLAPAHGFDAATLKAELLKSGMGFKEKKVDMFLRDMADFGVWQFTGGLDALNVASDMNTMRVALRSGLIIGRLPLLSSFLDVFCYQYALVDRITQKAWRTVWKLWGERHPETQPRQVAFIDFLIYYGIGKSFCWKTPKCLKGKPCPLRDHCPSNLRKLNPPKSISIEHRTGWRRSVSNEGGGLGLRA